ncbi:MAG: hypothetical protein DCC55_11375 [Chloroflexi bacterium]|nr:MAG: hypothetical protein DCC55_11375 [Chloroflexota bacterium]
MIHDRINYQTRWIVRRFADDAAFTAGVPTPVVDPVTGGILPAISEIEGNLLLNEGIGELWDLACGLGTPGAFDNTNSQIGVGDSTTSESATQTGLQASTNKLYKAVEAGYPQRSAQTVTWRAIFGSGDANFAWQEFTVANGNSDAAVNLNRKVSNQGTKASGQTWTLDLQITLS